VALIWSIAAGEVVQQLDIHTIRGKHRSVRVLPSGDRVITGVSDLADDPAVVWNATDGRPLHALVHAGEKITALEISPCGERLGAAGFERISVWDLATGDLQRVFARPEEAFWGEAWYAPMGVAISTAGVKVGRGTRRVFIWDGRTGELTRTLTMDGVVGALVMESVGGRVLAFTPTQAVVSEGEQDEVRALDGDRIGAVAKVAISTGGDIVATCSATHTWRQVDDDDPTLQWWRAVRTQMWDVSTGRLLHAWEEPSQPVLGGAEWACSVAVGPSRSSDELQALDMAHAAPRRGGRGCPAGLGAGPREGAPLAPLR